MSDEAKVIKLLTAQALAPEAEHRPEIHLSRGARGAQPIRTWTQAIDIPPRFRGREGAVWVAFIDLMPAANFEHAVRYAFVVPETGEVEFVDAMSPPVDIATNFKKVEARE